MFDKIKRLGTETAIYGVSTVVGRFLTFILTPIYTHFLPPGDLGIVATVYAYVAFLNVVYGYGLESAYMKYASTLELGGKKETFSVPFISIVASSLILSVVMIWQTDPLSRLAAIPSGFESLVSYSAGILFLDAVAIVPFAALRMEARPGTFAAIRLTSIVVNVGCNILFLFQYGMGIRGIFLSGIISSALAVVLLLPTIVARFTFHMPSGLYRALLKFGLPYLPSGLATMMIQVIDRPILEAISGKAAVGIYQANYRLGIFMMLIVSMYDFAWRPFFLSHAGDPDAKPLFARVLTYFTLMTTAIFLALSFFLSDIVRLPVFWGHPLVAAPYWGGLPIVPVVLLGYLFLGIYNNLVAGIYIVKKTRQLPLVTFAAALVNVAANYLLIPLMGIMGAAIATLASYAVMAVLLYVTVQRVYPVQYEIGRIGKVALSAAIVYALYLVVQSWPLSVLWKVLLLVLFGALMYWMKFLVPSELKAIARLMGKRPPGAVQPSSPADPSANGK